MSLLQLIATPREFHGKRVRVVGFAFLEFEGQGLYLHREDFEHALVKNSVWLDVPNPIPEAYMRLNEQYVIVGAARSASLLRWMQFVGRKNQRNGIHC